MVPWIQVYSNLPCHPKVGALVDALELEDGDVSAEQQVVGMLVSLWTWAQQTTPDGVIACSNRIIAKAMGWKCNPSILVDALVDCGFLDVDGDSLSIHDWGDYALLDELKAKNRDRQRRYRERAKWEEENRERIEGIINEIHNG